MANPQRPRLLTFNDPHPMRIDRDLAKEIGLNESIVLLQLEYLISISGNERDGRMWTYQSLTDLHETYFPWWSLMTIQRTLKSLEKNGLIIVGNYNKLGYDRTQWFALNEEGINKLHSVAIYQNDTSMYQNDKSIYQFVEMDHNKLINGSEQNDTTIPEITHKNTQREDVSANATAPRAPRKKTDKQAPKETTPIAVIKALANACQIDRDLASKETHIILANAAERLYKAGKGKDQTDEQIAETIRYVGSYFMKNDWRGKKGEPPTPGQLLDIWKRAIDARQTAAPETKYYQSQAHKYLQGDELRAAFDEATRKRARIRSVGEA